MFFDSLSSFGGGGSGGGGSTGADSLAAGEITGACTWLSVMLRGAQERIRRDKSMMSV